MDNTVTFRTWVTINGGFRLADGGVGLIDGGLSLTTTTNIPTTSILLLLLLLVMELLIRVPGGLVVGDMVGARSGEELLHQGGTRRHLGGV